MATNKRDEDADMTINLAPIARGFDRALVRFMHVSLIAITFLLLSETARDHSEVFVIAAIGLAILLAVFDI